MGIDVLNEKALRADLVEPTLSQLKDQTIPAMEAAVDASVEKAELRAQGAAQIDIDRLDKVLQDRLAQVAEVMKEVIAGLQAIVDRFDGLTVTVALKPKE